MARFLVLSSVCLRDRVSCSLGDKPCFGGIGQGAHHLIQCNFEDIQALISTLWWVSAGMLTWSQAT